MLCPFCDKDMMKGEIQGDGRMPFKWINDTEKNKSLLDKFADFVDKKGIIAKSNPLGKTSISGYLCNDCKKIILSISEIV